MRKRKCYLYLWKVEDAFRDLSADDARRHNLAWIMEYCREGLLAWPEAESLRRYNRKLYKAAKGIF